MTFKLFSAPTNEAVEAEVNKWLAEAKKAPTIRKSDHSIGLAKVPMKDQAGKRTYREVNYSSILVWYD